MKMKTIRDLAAEMRTLADDIEAGRAIVGQTVWRNYADDIEAAAKREREEAEAAGLAAGGMVEAARHAPPNPGGAAPSAPVGNAAVMREALEYLCSISDLDLSELEVLGNRLEDTSTYGGGLVLKLVHGVRNGQKALAASSRNCDVYSHDEALRVWAAEKENEQNGCFDEWLYHVATRQKGENDGSK